MLTLQILEINDNKCDKKSQDEVVSILRKNFKLSLKVRSNLPGMYKGHSLKVNKLACSLLTEFKQYMANPPKPPPEVGIACREPSSYDKSYFPLPPYFVSDEEARSRSNAGTHPHG